MRRKGMEGNWFSFYPVRECGSDEKRKEIRTFQQWLNTCKYELSDILPPPLQPLPQSLKPCSHFQHDEGLLMLTSSTHHQLLLPSLGVINRTCHVFKRFWLELIKKNGQNCVLSVAICKAEWRTESYIWSVKDVMIILLKIKMNDYLNKKGKVRQSSLLNIFTT